MEDQGKRKRGAKEHLLGIKEIRDESKAELFGVRD